MAPFEQQNSTIPTFTGLTLAGPDPIREMGRCGAQDVLIYGTGNPQISFATSGAIPGGIVIGLIPKLFLDWIQQAAGPEALAQIRQKAGIAEDQRYRLDTAYEDEEWRRLFEAALDVLGADQSEAEAGFAKHFYEDALKNWPMWFEISSTSRQFLERQPVIHNGFATSAQDPSVRKQIEEKFRLEKLPDRLVMHYCSPNHLCGLYQALAGEIMRHYGEEATFEEIRCMKSGAPECEFVIRWAEAEAA